MSAPLLALDDVEIRAGGKVLARCAALELRRGEALVIVGETGSGKSLLALAIMGALPAGLELHGGVRLAGEDITGDRARRLWGRRMALVPQEPWLALDPTMRAFAQVEEVPRLVLGHTRPRAQGRTRALLAALGLDAAEPRFPFALSGGMCQRVALAATRASDAELVIADEPTKGLDAALRDDVIGLLRDERARGATLVVITHDLEVARGVGGRLAVMLDSAIVEQGETAEVLRAPRHEYTRRLVAADPENWVPASHAPTGERVLAASGLGKRFGESELFRALDLDIARGEAIAVLGRSGSGKTTLGNALLGLVPLDAGHVARGPGLEALRFQKLYQDPAAAFSSHETMRGALRDVVRRHRLEWSRAEALMRRLRLSDALLDRRPDQISGGELQRFALARVLLVDPAFLFADEPTSRLDPITQKEVMTLLGELTRERGMAMLLVTHDRALAAASTSRQIALRA